MKLTTSVGVAALCAALGAASGASAQTYTRIVAFGDSLSDNGNLGASFPYPSPPYYQNRFSNGPTWVEDLQQLGLPSTLGHGALGQTTGSVDWAFGGAESGTEFGAGIPPGLETQVGGYMAAGGTFGPHDLVTIWAGANDIFDNLAAAGASPNPLGAIDGVAVTAAGNVVTMAGAVAKAGAGTVVVPNLPPLNSTPEFAGTIAAPLAQSATGAFNTALFAGLQADAKANPHTNFILIDANSMLVYDQAHAAQFGFANTTQACVTTLACVAASTTTQNTYLFWDGVHPTAAAHELFAAIVTDYVTYGDRGAAMGTETEASVRNRTETFDSALGLLQARDFGQAHTDIGASFDYDSAHVDARGVVASTTGSSGTLRINLDQVASSNLRWGALFSFGDGNVRNGALKFRDQTVGGDAFLGWRSGRLFVNGDAGVGIENIADIQRQTAAAQVVNHGSTQGWSAGGKLQAGAWYALGSRWSVSPRAALAFTHGDVDGYAEIGPFDRYQYAANAINATSLEGTVRLQGQLAGQVWAHLEGGYRDYVSYDAGAVQTTLVNNVAQTLSRTLEAPEQGMALIDAGVNGVICKDLKWDVSYRGRFGSRYDDDLAHAGLSLAF